MPPEGTRQPLIVAHRGGAGHGPENSLPAFRQAWALGADAIEGDFRLTADGQIVCIHDADTLRVTGTRRLVAASTLEELRRHELASAHGVTGHATRIPTLAEVFATVPAGKSLFLEIKCGTELIPPLRETIRQSGIGADRLLVISFHAEVIRALKVQLPAYPACWLASCRRDTSGRFRPSSAQVLQTLAQCGADGFGAHARLDDAAFIRAIVHAGLEFHAWDVNDPGRACWFRDQGAASLTTDHPVRLREALERNKTDGWRL